MSNQTPVQCDICCKVYCCHDSKKVKRIRWLSVDWLICVGCLEEAAKKKASKKERMEDEYGN